MLVEFSVANYRSFRNQVTLSMVASALKAKYPELDEKNLFTAPGDVNLLTSAAIYGANASGKSNLIAAFHFMRQFVINSPKNTERTGGIEAEPFRLDPQTVGEPSFFEVVFIADGKRYRYGFEVTREKVEAEWLYVVPTSREAKLFEREGDDISLGERFRAEGRDLIDRTRPNALFLSVVAQFNGEVAQTVLEWFRSVGIATGLSDMGMRLFTQQQLLDGHLAEEIAALMQRFDLGIEDLLVEKVPPSSPLLPAHASAEMHTILEPFLDLVATGERVAVRTIHRRVDELGQTGTEIFDLDEHESEGTKKLFAMSGPLVETLRNGEVLVVDELDARLHPLLTREIVKLFNDPETNPHHTQLIFATQDTNLLDNRLLRRDQIWFVEKDRQGASHLYSLAEFKVRNDASYEKEYMQGRFGAIPFLNGLRQVLEQG
ncbi:MAG: ATP-binding protein [Caldilineaceae bacterium]|nr:ATP-binding protein [Caldilineaceae bacterium]